MAMYNRRALLVILLFLDLVFLCVIAVLLTLNRGACVSRVEDETCVCPVTSEEEEYGVRAPPPPPDPDVKLMEDFILGEMKTEALSEEKEEYLRRKIDSFRLRCSCPKPPKWLSKSDVHIRRIREGRKLEYEKKRRQAPLVMCPAMSPLSYLGSGVKVEPFQTVPVAGLSLHETVVEVFKEMVTDVRFDIRSAKQLGVLFIDNSTLSELESFARVTGYNTDTLSITVFGQNIEFLNTFLKHINYKSTKFRIDEHDKLELNILGSTLNVFVHIRREPLPDLFDPGPGNDVISEQVTIITKTFERYDCLQRLVKSIRQFYPNIRIIIADDSEFPEIINEPNIRHLTIPFRDGCFAGRNLALSQVTTKYVLFADDDFVFTNETRLERMMEKLDYLESEIDIVTGPIAHLPTLNYIFKFAEDHGKGICAMGMMAIDQEQRKVAGFPQCYWGEMLNNFFMARTSVLRRIGFDPGFIYAGHEEFWLDAVGKARSIACYDVSVGHDHTETEKYGPYRFQTETRRKRDPHLLFSNNLCYWKNWEFEEKPETFLDPMKDRH
ncbi:beta-1,4 N-acetylgalactosaminyltransferase 1-like [Saccoglossus kowalevskii]|uniref:Beta-1,4 N-acetylgalactosaminyltransferase 1-like n=1 Tax=Saccoglossus kowalevskii TaxID=10224 RepID=A0ABM0GNN3_SACKO|nr:PREDICTED: beta-1,4 N-acetylgalactosaminyltransferase 1-like [Saccoglossus kowalevskii]